MLEAAIISLGQEMSFVDGESANVLTLRLPGGQTVKALISDEGARHVLEAFAEKRSPASSVPAAQESAPPFVGDEIVVVTPQRDVGGFVENTKFYAPSPTLEARPPQPRRAPRVDKDEAGNPIVQVVGGIDPSQVLGGQDEDDEGVGQI